MILKEYDGIFVNIKCFVVVNVCIFYYEINNRYFNFGNVGGESFFDVNILIVMFCLDDLKFIK